MLYARVHMCLCVHVCLSSPCSDTHLLWRGSCPWPVINARTSQDSVNMDQGPATRLQGLMSSLAAGRPFGLVSPLIGSSSLSLWNVRIIVNTQLTTTTGAYWVFKGLHFPLCSHDGAWRLSDVQQRQSWNSEMLYVTVVSTLSVSLESSSSLSWTSTLESYTESSIMDPTPRTARLDRSDSTFACGGNKDKPIRSLTVPNWLFCPQEETGGEVASSPPKSSFQKLAPSEARYTILGRDRDELWPQQPSNKPVTRCHAPGSRRGLDLGQASGTNTQHP